MSTESWALAVALALLVLAWGAIALGFSRLRHPVDGNGGNRPAAQTGHGAAEAAGPDEPPQPRPRLDLADRLRAAAGLVGASGLAVWAGDESGAELRVLAAVGYSPAFLERISPMPVTAQTLTTRVFVDGRPCLRRRTGSRPPTAVLPIERDGEVVGVLTAEIDADEPAVPSEAAAFLRLLAVQAARWLPATARPVPSAVVRPIPPPARLTLEPMAEGGVRVRTPPAALSRSVEVRREATTGESVLSSFDPIPVTVRVEVPPSADSVPLPVATPPEESDAETTLREARSRFVAGFRRRCTTIEEQVARMASEGTTGPALAVRPIVHRMAGLAVIVGMKQVSERAAELDRLLEQPPGLLDVDAIREACAALPAAFTADLASLPPLWAGSTRARGGAHVVVVTGQAALAERLSADLSSNGYRVGVESSGVLALALLQETRPDVVLLDVTLPGDPGGHDVCRLIKTDARLADLPVVLLAGSTSTVERMAGFALGADDFLTTPVETLELLLRVRWMLTRPQAQRGAAPKAGGGPMTAEAFLVAARDLLRRGPAALGLIRSTPAAVAELAVLFADDLRRKDLLGRYSETQIVVLMPDATASIAARRIGGVIDLARAAGLDQVVAGVAATGRAPERFLEPLLAAAETAQAAAQAQHVPLAVHGAEARPGRGTVLIVDDDPDVVHVIDARFKAAGLTTVLAFDGDSALHEAEVLAPAVMVLELMLPRRSGFDVLAGLRALPEPRPRVVVVSSRTREDDVMRAFELGADDYLTKPFSPQELLARVDRLLRAR